MLQNGKLADAMEELATLRSWLRATVSNLRNVISDLRPPLLDTTGLLKALDNLFARFKRDTGIDVDFESMIGGRLHPTLETLCYRIVQEALANVRQHAKAQNVLIQMRRTDQTLELIISDNGRGFDVNEAIERSLATGHIGLTSLTERAQVAGGTLQIISQVGRGTRLYFRMPFVGVTGPEMAGETDRVASRSDA
jgi:two-component system sensor histidine kinase DegS